jgi:hypothetical protein
MGNETALAEHEFASVVLKTAAQRDGIIAYFNRRDDDDVEIVPPDLGLLIPNCSAVYGALLAVA